jgi:hypothetical protein
MTHMNQSAEACRSTSARPTERPQALQGSLAYMRALIALFVLQSSPAKADKLDDFKEAVNHEGCNSIPYGDLHSICRSQQSAVHPWCDGDSGPITCDGGGTRDLRWELP